MQVSLGVETRFLLCIGACENLIFLVTSLPQKSIFTNGFYRTKYKSSQRSTLVMCLIIVDIFKILCNDQISFLAKCVNEKTKIKKSLFSY